MKSYIALIHKEKKTGYGVMFPDFPGCISVGDTLDEAVDMAREALAFHVEGLRRDKEKIPTPRDLDTIKKAKEDWIDLKMCSVELIPLMTGLFDQPDVNHFNHTNNPLTIAKALDKLGNSARIRMRKGAGYLTHEHKAAKLLRWYVSHGCSPRVAEQAKKLMHGLSLELSEARNAYNWIVVLFFVYFVLSAAFLIWLLG
jgi:predicted RNase H-like HicB family nuclease